MGQDTAREHYVDVGYEVWQNLEDRTDGLDVSGDAFARIAPKRLLVLGVPPQEFQLMMDHTPQIRTQVRPYERQLSLSKEEGPHGRETHRVRDRTQVSHAVLAKVACRKRETYIAWLRPVSYLFTRGPKQ